MTETKLTGDWSKANQQLKSLNKTISVAAGKAIVQSAYLVEATLVKHLQNQDLNWKRLSTTYLKFKEAKHLSNKILIATATMLNSITTKISTDRMMAFVGVLRSSKRKDGQAPVAIAAVHEFGSSIRNVPARPLFRPTLKEKKKDIENIFFKTIGKVIEDIAD